MITDTLRSVCETLYFPQSLTIRKEITRRQYRFAMNDFRDFIGREAIIDDLKKPVIIGFLKWLEAVRELAPKTCNERVGRIKALWQWLCEEKLIDRIPPKNIRLPEPERMPTAWTPDELQRLYRSAGEQPGQVAGIPAGKWWQALLLWLWCSGERYGATMALEWSMIDIESRTVTIPSGVRKGGMKTAVYRLWPDTMQAMIVIRLGDRVFPWDRCIGSYYHSWGVILDRAGLPNNRYRKTQSLRVSHATWLAAAGGDATASLMHSDHATTAKHYIDSRMVVEEPRLFRIGD